MTLLTIIAVIYIIVNSCYTLPFKIFFFIKNSNILTVLKLNFFSGIILSHNSKRYINMILASRVI